MSYGSGPKRSGLSGMFGMMPTMTSLSTRARHSRAGARAGRRGASRRWAALYLPAIARRHEAVPLAVVAQPVGAEHAVVVALHLDHVLILCHLALGRETRSCGVQRQHF